MRTSLVVFVVWTRVTPFGVMVSGAVTNAAAVTHLHRVRGDASWIQRTESQQW